MTTLAEIEAAADALPHDQKRVLLEWLAARLGAGGADALKPHSVLDIPPVSLGRILPQKDDDDLLGEMLEDRH